MKSSVYTKPLSLELWRNGFEVIESVKRLAKKSVKHFDAD